MSLLRANQAQSEKVTARLGQWTRWGQGEESSSDEGGTSATASKPRPGDRTMFGVAALGPLQKQT